MYVSKEGKVCADFPSLDSISFLHHFLVRRTTGLSLPKSLLYKLANSSIKYLDTIKGKQLIHQGKGLAVLENTNVEVSLSYKLPTYITFLCQDQILSATPDNRNPIPISTIIHV